MPTDDFQPLDVNFIIKGEKVTITRGKLLGRNSYNQNTYLGFCSSNSQLFAISNWVIQTKKVKNKKVKFEDHDSDISKVLIALDQEMSSLSKLQHRNLVSYNGLTHNVGNEGVDIHVAQEYVTGVDLSGYLSGIGAKHVILENKGWAR